MGERGCLGLLCCFCRNDPAVPRHGQLLELLMERANYSAAAKYGIRQSVLGPKWFRKENEKKNFAGEVIDDGSFGAAMEQVDGDFHDMAIDKEYGEALIEECNAHAKREYDVEETKVGQLRQLVATAEAAISGMRQRLL